MRGYGVPVVVALNKFASDSDDELQAVKQAAMDAGAFHSFTVLVLSSDFPLRPPSVVSKQFREQMQPCSVPACSQHRGLSPCSALGCTGSDAEFGRALK